MMIFLLTLVVFIGTMVLLILAQAVSRHRQRCHASLLGGCSGACRRVCHQSNKDGSRP